MVPDFKKFLDVISKEDLSFAEIPVTEENANDRVLPYLLQSSSKITCMILEKYHNWLTQNYDITPKK